MSVENSKVNENGLTSGTHVGLDGKHRKPVTRKQARDVIDGNFVELEPKHLPTELDLYLKGEIVESRTKRGIVLVHRKKD